MNNNTKISIRSINFSENNYNDIVKCCKNVYLNGNMSCFCNKLFEAAKSSGLKIEVDKYNKFTISELLNLHKPFYDFINIKCKKKISRNFKENFNAIPNEELKLNCYKFIISTINLLKRDAKLLDKTDYSPSIGTSQNISIYDADFKHMIYINTKNIGEKGGLYISKLLQFNQYRNQPNVPKLWNIILNFFNLNNETTKIELLSSDFKKLSKHLDSLKSM